MRTSKFVSVSEEADTHNYVVSIKDFFMSLTFAKDFSLWYYRDKSNTKNYMWFGTVYSRVDADAWLIMLYFGPFLFSAGIVK